MPGSGQWSCLGFAVADDAGYDQARIIEDRSEGVAERIAQFTAFVD